jgi:hypothetical protein
MYLLLGIPFGIAIAGVYIAKTGELEIAFLNQARKFGVWLIFFHLIDSFSIEQLKILIELF